MRTEEEQAAYERSHRDFMAMQERANRDIAARRYPFIRTPIAIREDEGATGGGGLPSSPAARIETINNLLGNERQYDEDGNFTGYSPQLISLDEAKNALEFPESPLVSTTRLTFEMIHKNYIRRLAMYGYECLCPLCDPNPAPLEPMDA